MHISLTSFAACSHLLGGPLRAEIAASSSASPSLEVTATHTSSEVSDTASEGLEGLRRPPPSEAIGDPCPPPRDVDAFCAEVPKWALVP